MALALLGTPPARAQATNAPAPRFDIELQAPEPLRAFLLRHAELQRFRELPDLDASELDRLVAQAPADLRNLLGTQGFFSSLIRVRVDRSSALPQVHIDIEPGPPTQVASVEGNIVVIPRFAWAAKTSASPAGAWPTIAPVSPRQRSTYSWPSTSRNRAPSASATTRGKGTGQRAIHGIGTPARRCRPACDALAADSGWLSVNRCVSASNSEFRPARSNTFIHPV